MYYTGLQCLLILVILFMSLWVWPSTKKPDLIWCILLIFNWSTLLKITKAIQSCLGILGEYTMSTLTWLFNSSYHPLASDHNHALQSSYASICFYAFTLLSCVTCRSLEPGDEAKYTSPYLLVLFTLFGLLSPCSPFSPAAVLDMCMCVCTGSESVYECITMQPSPPPHHKHQLA